MWGDFAKVELGELLKPCIPIGEEDEDLPIDFPIFYVPAWLELGSGKFADRLTDALCVVLKEAVILRISFPHRHRKAAK